MQKIDEMHFLKEILVEKWAQNAKTRILCQNT